MAKLPAPRDPLDSLSAFTRHATRIHLASRQTIKPPHSHGAAIYVVEKGTLSYGQVSAGTPPTHFGHLRRGDVFGEAGLFSSDLSPGPAFIVTAKTASDLLYISHEKLHWLLAQEPGLIVALCYQLDKRLQAFTARIASISFHDISYRVHQELIELASHDDAASHPEGMQVKISRKELSKLVSCSREIVGKVLSSLADAGVITVSGHLIVVRGTR